MLRQKQYQTVPCRVTYQKDKKQQAGGCRVTLLDSGLAVAGLTAIERDNVTQSRTQTVPQSVTQVSPFININNKQASLLYCNQESPPDIHGFNLLPPLTESEKAAIKALYPDDEVAAFNAMWAAREKKQ